MNKKNIFIIFTALFFLIASIISITLGNETIFPTVLLAFFLTLTFIGDKASAMSPGGKSARYAIIIFSILVGVLNILVSIFLPIIMSGSNIDVELTTREAVNSISPAQHFIEVTINDMHEFCYSVCILLIINLIFTFVFRKTKT
jgi:hypothetical protein